LTIFAVVALNNSVSAKSVQGNGSTGSRSCLSDRALSNAVLSLSKDYDEAQNAGRQLRNFSKRSERCRQQVISAVMKAMDKPNLDITKDHESNLIWREGAVLLGDLKARQALDLLISHITMSDGEWSITMVHQPALDGIIRMGKLAIPKLRTKLTDPDSHVRQAAVYCLAWIGGPSVRRAFQRALPHEADPCVKRFIEVSLDTIDTKSGELKPDRSRWLSAFLCGDVAQTSP